jgi:molybdopterin molybdotransferase
MSSLITVAEAQSLVVERAKPLDAERVPIERAFGRVLAEDVAARVDLPPFASSAMDGYALRSSDTTTAPVSLAIAGSVAAGSPASRRLEPGEAMAISTGGAVPEGADAVIPLELTRRADGTVEVEQTVPAGAHVRGRGGDVTAGTVVLERGVRLGAAQVGSLAAAGIAEVQCSKRPRVGILVTGSELRKPGDELGPGQIYESNGLMLTAQLTSAGAVPAQLGVVPDQEEEHRKTMERALLGFDMLVTSGGASVGPHDLVRKVQSDLRVDEVFWGVAVKPGKPVAFGVRREHLVFNLPGNPVSALVCFELFVRPAIEALQGIPEPLPAFSAGVLAAPVSRNAARDEFVRARAEHGPDGLRLHPVAGQDSHMIVSAARADTLVEVPRGSGELAVGADVRYLTLP